MEAVVENYLSQVKNFSGVVLVAKDDRIVFSESFGFAREGERNTLETNFGIGSVTKSFTALSMMQLVENNLIDLNARLTEFFPNVYPDKPITIEHLLTQTSGLRNYIYDKRVQTGNEFSPDELMKIVMEKPLKFQPGKKWMYSNTNYLLLARIIEINTGKSFHDYVKTTIFEPVGMTDTYFDGQKEDRKAQHGESVFNCHPSLLFGAGDIVSNVNDLFLYTQALEKGSLASPEIIKKMQQPSYKGMFVQYGYGWFVKNIFGQKSISHGGFHPIGYTSHLEKFVDDGVTIIVLSNKLEKFSSLGVKYFNSTDLAREIGARIYGKKAFPWQKMT
ncbi:MAG: beta-lactamase family protein [Bacillus sp. (in: Bacteria)]|nr:beta-lactamase family protein [Bacillus sp. (in: firmicutes)]